MNIFDNKIMVLYRETNYLWYDSIFLDTPSCLIVYMFNFFWVDCKCFLKLCTLLTMEQSIKKLKPGNG